MKRIISIIFITSNFISSVAFSAENVLPTLSGEATAILNDLTAECVDFSVTPLRIDNGNILLTLGVIGATALTYSHDKEIQQKVQTIKSPGMNKAADAGSLAGNPFIHLGLAALVYGSATVAESPKWKEVAIMMGEAFLLADASTLILKETVGRGRPDASTHKGDFKPLGFRNDYNSFPSMHTSSSFALASVLASVEDNFVLKTSYYLAAGFVAFSRIYQNRHWASDVILGAALGELSGRVVTNYHTSKSNYLLTPQAYESGAGLALVGKW